MNLDEKDYQKLKIETNIFYNNLAETTSPVFNQEIAFTASGFNHIVYKSKNTERNRSTQILRFKLLKIAIKLIKLSTTYQEYEEVSRDFLVKSHKKKISKPKLINGVSLLFSRIGKLK